MGIYWIIACHDRKEFIHPGDVKHTGLKEFEILANFPMPKLIAYLVMEDWNGCVIEAIPDSTERYCHIQVRYENITKRIVEEWNEQYATSPDWLQKNRIEMEAYSL